MLPAELQQLDGAPIAAVVDDNKVDGQHAVKPGTESAGITEFNLHVDGTPMKFIDRPDFAPQCLLVDGAGRQYGVVRNPSVADLICNGVNSVHLARTMMEAELAAAKPSGGAPPVIITP